jgi:Flp pilus assembly protein TadB
MAQTRKRRRTKHRGNAAGQVETRGRTGRKPTAGERKLDPKTEARLKREERLNRPPSWKAAMQRAALGAVFLAVVGLVLGNSPVAAIAFAVVAFALYVPTGYWIDGFFYRRRMAKQGRAT